MGEAKRRRKKELDDLRALRRRLLLMRMDGDVGTPVLTRVIPKRSTTPEVNPTAVLFVRLCAMVEADMERKGFPIRARRPW